MFLRPTSCSKRWQGVEAEHVVSGPGLERIYAYVRAAHALTPSPELECNIARGDGAAAIAGFALERQDPSQAPHWIFSSPAMAPSPATMRSTWLRAAGYTSGGIAPKILERLAAGTFVAAFNNKGAFSDLARAMPVHVVLNERLGMLGAARIAMRL